MLLLLNCLVVRRFQISNKQVTAMGSKDIEDNEDFDSSSDMCTEYMGTCSDFIFVQVSVSLTLKSPGIETNFLGHSFLLLPLLRVMFSIQSSFETVKTSCLLLFPLTRRRARRELKNKRR